MNENDKNVIVTYSKISIDPVNPLPEQISGQDIAHALSFLCRGNGHVNYFYSVAAHSVNCALEAVHRGFDRKLVLACLLHDASEAYLSDVTRPVKKHLQQYIDLEKRMQAIIWQAFSLCLSEEEEALVKMVDDLLLAHELFYLMNIGNHESLPVLESSPELGEWGFQKGKARFLEMLCQLVQQPLAH